MVKLVAAVKAKLREGHSSNLVLSFSWGYLKEVVLQVLDFAQGLDEVNLLGPFSIFLLLLCFFFIIGKVCVILMQRWSLPPASSLSL